ncbi:MAG: hypothetical protein ACI9MR_002130 [Myxococcota bacterium]
MSWRIEVVLRGDSDAAEGLPGEYAVEGDHVVGAFMPGRDGYERLGALIDGLGRLAAEGRVVDVRDELGLARWDGTQLTVDAESSTSPVPEDGKAWFDDTGEPVVGGAIFEGSGTDLTALFEGSTTPVACDVEAGDSVWRPQDVTLGRIGGRLRLEGHALLAASGAHVLALELVARDAAGGLVGASRTAIDATVRRSADLWAEVLGPRAAMVEVWLDAWVRGSTVVVEADAAERGAQRSDALEVEAAWRSESGVLGELRLVGDGAAQVQLHAVLSADDGAVLAACDQRLDVAGACAFQLPMAPPAGLRPMRLRVEVSPVIRGRECIARLRLR